MSWTKHLRCCLLAALVFISGLLAVQAQSSSDERQYPALDRTGPWAWMAHAMIEPSEHERYGLQAVVTRWIWESKSGFYVLHGGFGGDFYIQDERIFEVVKGHTRVIMPAVVLDQRFQFALWQQPVALALTSYAGMGLRTTDARVEDPVLGIDRDIHTDSRFFALGIWWQASVAVSDRLWLQGIVRTDLSRLVDPNYPAVFNEQPGILFGLGLRQVW